MAVVGALDEQAVDEHARAAARIWAAGVPDTFTPDKLSAVNSDLQLDDAALQGLLKQLADMRMLRRTPVSPRSPTRPRS